MMTEPQTTLQASETENEAQNKGVTQELQGGGVSRLDIGFKEVVLSKDDYDNLQLRLQLDKKQAIQNSEGQKTTGIIYSYYVFVAVYCVILLFSNYLNLPQIAIDILKGVMFIFTIVVIFMDNNLERSGLNRTLRLILGFGLASLLVLATSFLI